MYPKLFIPRTTTNQHKPHYAICCPSAHGNQVEQWTGDSEQEAVTILTAMADPNAAIYELKYYNI